MSPALLEAVAELKFIPCVERVVESLRRDVKISAKHVRLGPTKVSLSVRLAEIKTLVREDPDFLAKITALFDDMRHVKRSAELLGVLHHPDLFELLMQGVTETGQWWIRLQHVVHRCILTEQFVDFSDARKTHTRKTKQRDTKEAQAAHNVLALPKPDTYEGIMARCICDHFRTMAQSSCFFSLLELPPGDAYQLVDLQTAVPAPPPPPVPQELSGHRQHVFRMLHGQPERMKLGPAPAALKPLFEKGSYVVTLHDTVHDAETGPVVGIAAATVPQLLKDLHACPLQVLRQDLGPDVKYTLPCPEFPSSDVTSYVTRLLELKAIPGEPYERPLHGSDSLCLQLEHDDFLQVCRGQRQSMLVRLTELGMTRLRVVSALSQPQPVCARGSQALAD